jgi:hypothetical protein
MGRPVRTQEELKKARRHVSYEACMLEETAQILPSFPNLQDPRDRAVLESFLIHFRNLFCFLYREAKNISDITAEDLIDPKVWRTQWLRKESSSLTNLYKRAHKEVAHLAYDRLENTASATPWPIPEIKKQILDAYAEFDKLAEPKCRQFDLGQSATANVVTVSITGIAGAPQVEGMERPAALRSTEKELPS